MTLASLLALGAEQHWNAPLLLLLVKATLILVAALGITLAMQRASAGARHLVWLVTLGSLALIPALTAWAPLRLEILPARADVVTPDVPAVPRPAYVTAITNGASRIVASAPTTATPGVPVAREATPAPRSSGHRMLDVVRGASVWTILFGLWAVVAIAIGASLTWSALVVRRLVRRAHPLDDPSWMTPLWEVSDRMGLGEPPRLLLSHDAKMPFACGLLTPTIVLPSECEQWSPERRLAVLLHELAHVRRRDLVGHTLGRIVCAVYWFHPLVWTAARQLRSESERACDDLALACGTRATDYAEHLLEIVTSVRREATPMVALAMARRKEFEGRMLAILDPELRHSTPSRRQSATLIGTLAMIALVVGAASPAPASARPRTASSAHPTTRAATERAPDTVLDAEIVSAESAQEADVAADARRAEQLDVRGAERTTRVATDRASRADSSPIAGDSTTKALGKALGGFVSTVLETVVPRAIDAGASSLRVTAQELAKNPPKGSKAADDRPELLAKVLRSDTSASLRRVAAWGLAEYADQTVAVTALANAVRHDADESVREMAAWALGEGNDDHADMTVEALSAALKDASVRVRRTAAWALGNVGDDRAATALVAALADASPDVRTRAAWALGNVGPKQAPSQLVAMLSDKDERVRRITAWALYNIEDPASAPALQAALRTETSKDLQIDYIRALAAMGEKSVEAIRPLLESSDPRVKSMAVHALAGGQAAGPWPYPWPEPRPYP
jgi:beta-lactamase regulating signal transducer with metallopeptidase domain/HEAT repeat protein